MTGRRAIVVAALAAAGAVLIASPAAAPPPPPPSTQVEMKVSKHENGPFRATAQLNPENGPKTAYLRVKSLTGDNEPAFLEQSAIPIGFTFKYFTKNGA